MKKKIVPLIAIFLMIIFLSTASFAEKTIDQKIADLEKKSQTVPEKEKVGVLKDVCIL